MYFCLIFFLLITLTSIKNFYKFFFYTEIIWILLFVLLLTLNSVGLNNGILINVFFILVFTAIEAILISCFFLLYNKITFLKI